MGALTEVLLDHYGIGELRLLMPALAALSQRSAADDPISGWITWIAPPFVPYAPALANYGVDLSRVLLVHPSADSKDCLWATEQALRSGSCVAALAWIERADDTSLRRLQLAAEEGGCWGIIFRPADTVCQSSPAALRLKLSVGIQGVDIQVLKCRGGYPSTISGIKLCPSNTD
jgi:cell division inhibitor SulA/protein ImuA